MARKTEKGGKFRNVHCRTWNMARKLKIMEMRIFHLTTCKMTKSLTNVKNEKCTMKHLEYGEKTEIKENEKYTLQDVKYGEEN